MEPGLLRFEAYRFDGLPSLIIHETFADTKDLKSHLTKGTAEKSKKQIKKIASPDCYYFRGPVSWRIWTCSRFMRLPVTYTSQGFTYARPGGNLSTGLDPHP